MKKSALRKFEPEATQQFRAAAANLDAALVAHHVASRTLKSTLPPPEQVCEEYDDDTQQMERRK